MPRLLAFFALLGLVACTPSAPLPSEPTLPISSPQPAPSGGSPTPSPASSSATPMASPSASALPPAPGTRTIQALKLEGSRFLNASGQRITLSVRDQDGTVIAPEQLRFVSSRPQDLRVDAQGQVQALVDNGFSTITISLLGSDLQIEQLFSVASPSSSWSGGGGGGGGGGSAPTQENVSGQVAFQF